MWNRFKIWLNRNDFKIVTYIIVAIGIYVMLRGLNVLFKNRSEEEKRQIAENINNENISVAQKKSYEENELISIDSTSEEFDNIETVVKKVFNTSYQANKNNDENSKMDIINMCSNKFIENLTTPRREITTENILNYFLKVENISNYSIGKMYQFNEKNNIKKYGLVLDFDDGGPAITSSYFMINMDYNNKTFNCDGNYFSLSAIDGEIYEELIENKGCNTF